MNRRLVSLLLVLAWLLGGCAAPPAAPAQPAEADAGPPPAPAQPAEAVAGPPYPTAFLPTGGWQTAQPAEQGFDPARLQAAVEKAGGQGYRLESLLVIRNGYLVSETYFRGADKDTKHQLYSVTKSFIATLVGIAVDQGRLSSVDLPALDLLPGRSIANSSEKAGITVEHLLTMSTGLDWVEGDPAYRGMYMSGDWVKNVLDLPVVEPPGERFNYCSGCSHILAAVLDAQLDEGLYEFAQENLFKPLGITNMNWETDAQGIPIGGWGLNLTPRDMAKLGYLYLHEGRWGDRQIVSAEWVRQATSVQIDGGGRLDYGYQWWIASDVGAYMALGRDGQMVYVAPEYDVIVVTTASLPGNHDPLFALVEEDILPAIVDGE